MNIRQQKYKKNRIMGMNKYNAAMAAGYAHTTATTACQKLEPKIASLQDHLERAGLTDKILADKLLQLTTANKVLGYLHQYKKVETGRIEKLSPDEVISNEFLETPDNNIRLKALELLSKLRQHLTPAQNITNITRIDKIEVNVSDDTQIPLTQESRNGIPSKR